MRTANAVKLVERCYTAIEQSAKEHQARLFLPRVEPELEQADSSTFCQAIAGRISEADAVILVFTAADVSGPVELAMASFSGKKLLILAAKGTEVPRMIRGLPGVAGVVEFDEREIPLGQIGSFLREAAF